MLAALIIFIAVIGNYLHTNLSKYYPPHCIVSSILLSMGNQLSTNKSKVSIIFAVTL